MIPVIALIGRPNVGKSTLFNRLTHTRNALVTDFPGLTRDRNYGHTEWQGYKLIIIDTGGIDGNRQGINISVVSQSRMAIEEADIILFIVDCHVGLTEEDKWIANYLRSRKKKTIIVANKTDGVNIDSVVSDFYPLGINNIIPIDASQGYGVKKLLEQVILILTNNNFLTRNKEENNEFIAPSNSKKEELVNKKEVPFHSQLLPIKLAIVGCPNVGKSTLINSILGKDRMVVYDVPGTTRDSIYIPIVHNKREYILIDTAGVRRRSKVKEKIEKFSIIKTLQTIEDANVVLLVIDAHKNISNQDLSILNIILDNGRSVVIAVNKCDNLSRNNRNKIKKNLDYRLNFINFVQVHFISALHGSGIGNLLKSVNKAYQCATKRINTALLTRIMLKAVDEHRPPRISGRRNIKLKYAHIGGYNPPIVVIHGTQVTNIPNTYKRYLINYFRRSLKMIGTPIRILFNNRVNIVAKSKKNNTKLTG